MRLSQFKPTTIGKLVLHPADITISYDRSSGGDSFARQLSPGERCYGHWVVIRTRSGEKVGAITDWGPGHSERWTFQKFTSQSTGELHLFLKCSKTLSDLLERIQCPI